MTNPIAQWSPEHDCWLTPDDETESLFSVPSAVFSETWTRSGTWADGTAYELPTSEHHTDGSGSSSSPSLPTPRATRGGSSTETVALLPTPDAYSAERGGPQSPEKRKAGGHSVTLADTISSLPPEPQMAPRADPISGAHLAT